MTSKLTREQAEDTIEGLEGLIGRGVRSVYLDMAITGMRQLMAALDSEPVAWLNGCNKSVPAALRYLAENPRPIGGESSFNAAHLYQLAREIELMAEGTLYRHAQPVVPDAAAVYAQLSDHEKWSTSLENVNHVLNAFRAAMLAAAPQEVK